MRTIGLSILHNELLSPAVTGEWMKPHGHASSLATSIGAPWEIYRVALPVSRGSERTRVSDIYTKAGGQAGYGSIFALSPDHGVGFSINVAGLRAGSARWAIREAVGATFLPVFEAAAADYAAEAFAGTYVDPNSEQTNITLTVDPDLPGLGLEGFWVEGADWRSNMSVAFGAGAGIEEDVSIRLIPNEVIAENGDMGFWAITSPRPVTPRSGVEGGELMFETSCTTWQSLAFNSFGGYLLEQFIIGTEDGVAKSIAWPFSAGNGLLPGPDIKLEKVEA